MVLRIEKEWGRDPGWFYSLSKKHQVDLLGLARLDSIPLKERRGKAKADKAALIRQKIQEYGNRDKPLNR